MRSHGCDAIKDGHEVPRQSVPAQFRWPHEHPHHRHRRSFNDIPVPKLGWTLITKILILILHLNKRRILVKDRIPPRCSEIKRAWTSI